MVTDNLALGRLKTALRSNRVGPGALGNHGDMDLLAWGTARRLGSGGGGPFPVLGGALLSRPMRRQGRQR